MYIVHNFINRRKLVYSCNDFQNQFNDHRYFNSLPGAGFAAYRFQVCSEIIITQFSAFVNNMSTNSPKKVLDKMQAVWYNDRKSTPSNVLTAAPVDYKFLRL